MIQFRGVAQTLQCHAMNTITLVERLAFVCVVTLTLCCGLSAPVILVYSSVYYGYEVEGACLGEH